MNKRIFTFALLAVIVLGASPSIVQATTITIVNKDGVGVGFNDATVAVPVGGNTGTTLGEQRLNVFQAAASIWAARINSSITIRIAAQFGPLTPCSPSSGILGSAGPATFVYGFTGAPRANTWYPVALASALAGTDLAAYYGLADGAAITASFNSNIGTSGCLSGTSWYLGLDANHGSQIDLETVLLHEFAHGLGISGLVSLTDGSTYSNIPDIFAHYTYDNSALMYWDVMSNGQRLTSSTNNGNVVFDGTNTTSGASILSAGKDGSGHPKLFTPSPVQQGSSVYHFDTTAFPNQLMEPSINSDLTHNVDLPNDLTTSVMKDIGWPVPSATAAPTNVVATGTSSTSIQVTWTASVTGGVTGYNVYRSQDNVAFTLAGSTVSPTVVFNDTVSTNKAYMYYVRAVLGTESSNSNKDFAVALAFTDSLSAGVTPVKAVHFTELRTAASALRVLAAQGAASYAESIVANTTTVKASHITELRNFISGARTALGFSSGTYTTTPAISSVISTADVTDLRDAVK